MNTSQKIVPIKGYENVITVEDAINARLSCFNVEGKSQFHRVIIGKQFYPIESEKSVNYFEHIAWINNDGDKLIDPNNGKKSAVVSWVYLSKGLIHVINKNGQAEIFPNGRFLSEGYTL